MSPLSERQKTEKGRFASIFTDVVVRDLIENIREVEGMPEQVVSWYEKSLLYNALGGKLNRGLALVDSVEILKGSPLSDQEYKEAAILGWCVELLQSWLLIADDLMDKSTTRRDQPCWYLVEGVGNIAINDAFMVEASVYLLLKKYFRQKPYYVDLLELFLDTTYKTELGQSLDLLTAPEGSVDLSTFSMDNHFKITKWKTSFYSFYLPVALALRMSGITNEAAYKQALDILIPMGVYFQNQDDYLDVYGTVEQIGKKGSDIVDGKASWTINVALQYATREQRKVLEDNYGVKDEAKEARVKEVFSQAPISLPERFESYENESYAEINEMIDKVDEAGTGTKKVLFSAFLSRVYKRSK